MHSKNVSYNTYIALPLLRSARRATARSAGSMLSNEEIVRACVHLQLRDSLHELNVDCLRHTSNIELAVIVAAGMLLGWVVNSATSVAIRCCFARQIHQHTMEMRWASMRARTAYKISCFVLLAWAAGEALRSVHFEYWLVGYGAVLGLRKTLDDCLQCVFVHLFVGLSVFEIVIPEARVERLLVSCSRIRLDGG